MGDSRSYEQAGPDSRRSAPAALRNREPIAEVLAEWLPGSGLVLEIASGTGEHAVYFAERFAELEWQPSDVHPASLESIRAWRASSNLANLREPIMLDASSGDWPIERSDAVLSINMVHISPWESAIGLARGSSRLLSNGGALILYGPWLSDTIETTASNLAFDSELKARNPAWGLRSVENFEREAGRFGLRLAEKRAMPANNLILLFRKETAISPL